jgi:hypothetical protein
MTLRTIRIVFLVSLAAVALTGGCAGSGSAENGFDPVVTQAQSESVYAVPTQNPQGTVRVSSSGLVRVKTARAAAYSLLHLHFVVLNQSKDQNWVVYYQEQTVAYAGHGELRPRLANSDIMDRPGVAIGPQGDQKTFDFYYEAPPDSSGALTPDAAFEFHWVIHTGLAPILGVTAFNPKPP